MSTSPNCGLISGSPIPLRRTSRGVHGSRSRIVLSPSPDRCRPPFSSLECEHSGQRKLHLLVASICTVSGNRCGRVARDTGPSPRRTQRSPAHKVIGQQLPWNSPQVYGTPPLTPFASEMVCVGNAASKTGLETSSETGRSRLSMGLVTPEETEQYRGLLAPVNASLPRQATRVAITDEPVVDEPAAQVKVRVARPGQRMPPMAGLMRVDRTRMRRGST